MKKFLLFKVVALTMASTALAESTVFDAVKSDATVSALVGRWAALDGRDLKWEAPFDFPINDAQQFNEIARPRRVDTLDQAFERLNRVLASAVEPTPAPFVACVFKDVLVVRTMAQPKCHESLP